MQEEKTFVLWDCYRGKVCAPHYTRASVNFYNFEELYLCQTWQFCQFKGALSSRDERFSPTCPFQNLKKTLERSILTIFLAGILSNNYNVLTKIIFNLCFLNSDFRSMYQYSVSCRPGVCYCR